jgi:hypothetical protein
MTVFIQLTCGFIGAYALSDDEQESNDATVSPCNIILFFFDPNIGFPG